MKAPFHPSTVSLLGSGRARLALAGSVALALATSTLLAAPGGGKGKPDKDGGGGEDPPPDDTVEAIYTAAPIPTPSWADRHSPSSINNDGMVVGWAKVEVSRGTFQSTDGFLWEDGVPPRRLPGLPGDDASWPQDLSDDGSVIVGRSSGAGGQHGVAWVKQADGSYLALPLTDKMMAYAAANLPEWPIESIEIGILQSYLDEPVFSADGEFLAVYVNLTPGGWIEAGDHDFGALVRWDWRDPLDPLITGMWMTGTAPQPDQSGIRHFPDSVEVGYKNVGTPEEEEVVWMTGFGNYVDYEPDPAWTNFFASRMEFHPQSGEFSFLNLDEQLPGASGGSASSVNALGEVAGALDTADANNVGYAWGIDGSPRRLDLLPGATRNYTSGINAFGELVGTSSGPERVACLWSVLTGEAFDLDALTEGNLGLERALSINERGQITAGRFDYKANKLVSTNWYVLTLKEPR